MLDKLTETEYQQLYSILKEKLSYVISKKRNLFNYDFLDNLEGDIMNKIKTSDSLIFKNYNNIYQVIDNFENNIERYINTELQKLGD